MTEEVSMREWMREISSSVKSLADEVTVLRKSQCEEEAQGAPNHKRFRDGEEPSENPRPRDGEGSDRESAESDDEGNTLASYALSLEGDAFLAAAFGSSLNHADRRRQLDKSGRPESKWLKTPKLSSTVASILPKEAIKENKRAFREQQLWLEAAASLTSILEKGNKDDLDPGEMVTLVQSSLLLMGDASRRNSMRRRETLLKHLNPQIAELMKEEDYSEALPFLFGTEFSSKAKSRMDEANALKKFQGKGKERTASGFQGGYPRKNYRGRGGGRFTYGQGPTNKKWRPAPTQAPRPQRK